VYCLASLETLYRVPHVSTVPVGHTTLSPSTHDILTQTFATVSDVFVYMVTGHTTREAL